MISTTPYRRIVNRDWIVNRWITYRIGIRIGIGRIIKWHTNVDRPAVITEPETKTRLKIPFIVRIKINISRMIAGRQVNMIDYYLLILSLCIIIILTVLVAVLIISIIYRFITHVTKTGITTGQTNQQYQENHAV
jgi:hypothetical protein